MKYKTIPKRIEMTRWLNLRIDDDTHTKLKELSNQDMRSMSAMVRFLIQKEYDRRIITDKPQQPYAAE